MVAPVVVQFSGEAGDFGREHPVKSARKKIFAFFFSNPCFSVDTKPGVLTIQVA
jgi:hypothetical protein